MQFGVKVMTGIMVSYNDREPGSLIRVNRVKFFFTSYKMEKLRSWEVIPTSYNAATTTHKGISLPVITN